MLLGCNTSEQTDIDEDLQALDSNSSEITFTYDIDDIELTQNITSLSNLPSINLEDYYFQVTPTLPTGLSIDSATGIISGTATTVQTKSDYIVEAIKEGKSSEYAKISFTVLEEPPTSVQYSSSTLSFTKNTAGSFVPSTTGGTPTSFAISPTLPAGLSFDSDNGTVAGTPTEVISSVYTVTASNTTGSYEQDISIVIDDEVPNFSAVAYSNSTQTFTIGTDTEITDMIPSFDSNQTDTTYSVLPQLPNGISIDNTGTITGTPTEGKAITTYTITASNGQGSDTATITLTVNNPAQSLSYETPLFSASQEVGISPVAIDTYVGSKPATYSIQGCTRDSVVIVCPTEIQVDSVTGTLSGRFLNTDVVGEYVFTVAVVDAQTTTTVTSDVTIQLGENAPDDSTDLGYNDEYNLQEGDQSVSIIPTSNVGGNASSYTISSSNYAISGGGLLLDGAGLQLNATTGEISSYVAGSGCINPGASSCDYPDGEVQIEVTGTNDDYQGNPTIVTVQTVTVYFDEIAPLSLGYNDSGDAEYDTSLNYYNLQVGDAIASGEISPRGYTGGDADSFSIFPGLPSGLTFNTTNGEITGTPVGALALTSYTITATNGAGSRAQTIQIKIEP